MKNLRLFRNDSILSKFKSERKMFTRGLDMYKTQTIMNSVSYKNIPNVRIRVRRLDMKRFLRKNLAVNKTNFKGGNFIRHGRFKNRQFC